MQHNQAFQRKLLYFYPHKFNGLVAYTLYLVACKRETRVISNLYYDNACSIFYDIMMLLHNCPTVLQIQFLGMHKAFVIGRNNLLIFSISGVN